MSKEEPSKRIRTMTERSMAAFEDRVKKHEAILQQTSSELQHLLSCLGTGEGFTTDAEAHAKLNSAFLIYDEEFAKFMNFLKLTNTEHSQKLVSMHTSNYDMLKSKYNSFAAFGQTKAKSSHRSSRSNASWHSSRSAHLDTELAKAQLEHDKIKADLKQRQLELENQIRINETMLKLKKAEIKVAAESVLSDLTDGEFYDKMSRTASFVRSLVIENPVQNVAKEEKIDAATPNDVQIHLSNYLARKELLSTRVTNFDDRPEMFRAWKISFKAMIRELQANPREELDLLVKWLGPDSGRQAQSIRAANVHCPDRGVQRVWERLEERYARPESVEASLQSRLEIFPKLTHHDNTRLYDLCDIVSEILAIKEDPNFSSLLAYYDSSMGVNKIVNKLPHNIRDKWTNEAANYKERHHVHYPPFSFFEGFLRRQARIRNDPSFKFQDEPPKPRRFEGYPTAVTKKTESTRLPVPLCPIHNTGHSLNDCRSFLSKPEKEKKEFLFINGLCFKCCETNEHRARDCSSNPKCKICNQFGHATALHVDSRNGAPKEPISEEDRSLERTTDVSANCVEVCRDPLNTSKSCAKIVLTKVYPAGEPHRSRMLYAVIDDQSNRTLANSDFFNSFHEIGPETPYTLASCSGKVTTSGRTASGYIIEAFDGSSKLALPEILECDGIPANYDEIPTARAAAGYEHLKDIAALIPERRPDTAIELLIGRDLISAHHVHDQRVGPNNLPYAQKGALGWVIVGEVCLGKIHKPNTINVNKTYTHQNGRSSLLRPCESVLETTSDPIFKRTRNDEKQALSIEDQHFLRIMDEHLVKGPDGRWIAPLPFREGRPTLPNNRSFALHRAKTLDNALRRNPKKRDHMLQFMARVLADGHAEVASPNPGTEVWYLPLFGVYHPKKVEKIRVVFDSSATYLGISLNDVLLKGPDLTNSLLGVLMNFRTETVAVTCDIQQMFYNFKVCEPHRDFLRFFWYENNDTNQPLIEYRMTVHIFGNAPSPAIATLGLRRAVENSSRRVKDFVHDNFYVDDGLASCSSVQKAVDLIKETQTTLATEARLRLHKITSNRKEVLSEFQPEDLANGINTINLQEEALPQQRSLGLLWDVTKDTFTFEVGDEDGNAFSRRGVLSTVNGIFDPLGFAAPVLIEGKLLLREMMVAAPGDCWDAPFPSEFEEKWRRWKTCLALLERVNIPRAYSTSSFAEATTRTVHIFSDASKDAIGAVADQRG